MQCSTRHILAGSGGPEQPLSGSRELDPLGAMGRASLWDML